ncbi:MAG: rhodanese-like domain-containing protein [Bryobacterales bacterium]|nr:rhodanese-like domain-containing protein [Bryobacterales bacterium]
MKKLTLLVIAGLAIWGCTSAPDPAAQAPAEHVGAAHEAVAAKATEMDPAAVKAKLDAGEDIYLLDVRNPDELEEHGMIAGAVNIPIDQLEARLAEVPKDKEIVTYCMKGGRASRAADILRSAGYEKPIEFGGITAWKEAGNPVVQPKSE